VTARELLARTCEGFNVRDIDAVLAVMDPGVVVDVHQVVRDPAGKVMADQMVQHVYEFRDGLITRMEIRKP
jgi:hypothetical protein